MFHLNKIFWIFLAGMLANMHSFADNGMPPLSNRLKGSLSPYLALHGEDPVAWQAWSPEVLERARRENKLLFISIGYFSCHWCHVMQKESYRNAEIAALINRHFIPVKVDREIEVALDAEMIAYAQDILGAAGWPLNVFVTPEGYPLYAILYQPPQNFRLMLEALAKEWDKDSAGLQKIARNTARKEPRLQKIKVDAALAATYRKQLVNETLEQADMLGGGLNVPRKFPLSPQLSVLLQLQAMAPDTKLAEWLRLTLDRMLHGGLRDHLGGGFFRYTVDPDWQHPHFEKMLYDNAQIALVYLHAARVLQQPLYRDIAIQTLDFMLDEMRMDGGIITSVSALSDKGREGEVYLWQTEQLKGLLQANEYALLEKIWGMDMPAEFEGGGYLPLHRKIPAATQQDQLQEIYSKLMRERKKRVSPRDIKMLAGLNGLALAAFSEAAGIDPRFAQAADELRNFLLQRMLQNGELLKGVSQQQTLGKADLEGYAYTAYGLLKYAQHRERRSDAELARKLALTAWQKFYSGRGFVHEEKGNLPKVLYQAAMEDSPLPSPSALLIEVSLLSGDQALRKKAQAALALDISAQGRGMFWNATQVMALSRLYPQQVTKNK